LNELSAFSVIAIDGPAASGKSTVARQLAQFLGFSFVNSGAMYRAVAWLAHLRKINPSDDVAVAKQLGTVSFQCGIANKESFVLIDGENPERHLKEEVVNRTVSAISAIEVIDSSSLSVVGVIDEVLARLRQKGLAVPSKNG
jgi:cytidylate kinase